jgi:hypothetical protein
MNFTNRLHSCRAAALEPLLDFRRPVIPIRGLPDVHATCDGTLFYCDKIQQGACLLRGWFATDRLLQGMFA